MSTIPIFVKSGSVIPFMPVMQYIGQRPDYPLILDIFPAGINKKAMFEVYEDDGETNDYQRNIFSKRKVQCLTKKDFLEIESSIKIENNYVPVERGLIFNVFLNQVPKALLVDGKKLKMKKSRKEKALHETLVSEAVWFWDETKKICSIFIPPSNAQVNITIQK